MKNRMIRHLKGWMSLVVVVSVCTLASIVEAQVLVPMTTPCKIGTVAGRLGTWQGDGAVYVYQCFCGDDWEIVSIKSLVPTDLCGTLGPKKTYAAAYETFNLANSPGNPKGPIRCEAHLAKADTVTYKANSLDAGVCPDGTPFKSSCVVSNDASTQRIHYTVNTLTTPPASGMQFVTLKSSIVNLYGEKAQKTYCKGGSASSSSCSYDSSSSAGDTSYSSSSAAYSSSYSDSGYSSSASSDGYGASSSDSGMTYICANTNNANVAAGPVQNGWKLVPYVLD